MNRIATRLMSLFAVSMGALAVSAAPIPINGPTTITQSGDYVVTSDIAAVGMPVIQFAGPVEATINLAGHTISASGAPAAVLVNSSSNHDLRSVTLRNGRISNSQFGVYSWSDRSYCCSLVTIEKVTFTSAPIWVEDGRVVATSSRFLASDLDVDVNFGGAAPIVEGNQFIASDIFADGTGRIVKNAVYAGSIYVGGDGDLDTWNVTVFGNRVLGGSILVGGQSPSTSFISVTKNVVSGFIKLDGVEDSTVYANQIYGCGGTGSSVELDNAWRNHIDSNHFLGGCDHGIWFGDITFDNRYSDNVFPGLLLVPEPVVDLGTNNGPELDVAPDEGLELFAPTSNFPQLVDF